MQILFSVTSSEPKPDIATLDDESYDTTFPCDFGAKQPIVPPSLNEPLNKLATMAVVPANPTQRHDHFSPESPEPWEPSPISTPLLNLSSVEGWETAHTTTDDNFFYSEDEPRRVRRKSALHGTSHPEGKPRRIYLLASLYAPSSPRKRKRKLEMGLSFPKRGRVSQNVSEAHRQTILPTEDIPGPSTKD